MDTLKRAIDLADLHQLADLAFRARMEYCQTAGDLNKYALTLPHFPLLLNYSDQHSEATHPHSIFYLYTVALFALLESPEVKKEALTAAALDLEERMMRYGIDRLRILQDIIILHFLMGNLTKAEECAEEIKSEFSAESLKQFGFRYQSRIFLAYSIGFHQLYSLRWEEAMEYLNPIIRHSGSDNRIKFLTQSLTLIPLSALGDASKATFHYNRLLRSSEMKQEEIAVMGDMIAFGSIIGDWENVMQLFEKSIPHTLFPDSRTSLAAWLRGVRHLLRRLPDEWWQANKLNLPQKHPLYREDGQYAPKVLLDYFSTQREKYLKDLEKRNGNDAFTKYHRYWDEMADGIQIS